MEISIFGLGYVGIVSASCLANEEHNVIGVDPNITKVNLINEGKSPIIEPQIPEIISDMVSKGRLCATTDPCKAVMATEISLICVGTPSQLNGSLDLKYVRRVCEDIGRILKNKKDKHVIVCRSTMLPGSIREVVIPTLEEYSSKKVGIDFGVCNNPEFLREGTAVYDFYNPAKTVIGETDSQSGDLLASLYSKLDAPLIRTDVETAEMVKYTDNVWHAIKVSFANEIGNISKALCIDGHKVMNIFCQDTKLNLSAYYMKPGFAFGGSCLPKDVRALTYKGRSLDLDLPLLNAILPSNQRQVKKGLNMIMSLGNKKIGILGFSFKAETDDLRESPLVEVIEHLLGKGYDLRIYDKNVNLAKLIGANKDYILNHIPHISKLMVESIDEVIEHAQTIVIGNNASEFKMVLDRLQEHQVIVDLVRITEQNTKVGKYNGICW
ncbi:MAG: nucleotide sugar dehydrogenase [Bacteroidales bacterium]|nr:nucleotide sugar dehydrogenase [Bacteroidales bacterium]